MHICREIEAKGFSNSQWAEIESDDMFQTSQFVGGYDADEREFCFSYRPSDGGELWFQFGLDQAKEIATGKFLPLAGREAE